MSKVITFSRTFPAYHPKAGEPTFFVEKVYNSLYELGLPRYDDLSCDLPIADNFGKLRAKHHTIRAGNRWKVGDNFSPRVWGSDINPKNGRIGPYNSKQIIIAPDVEIKKIWKFTMVPSLWADECTFRINGKRLDSGQLTEVAYNDGLTLHDLIYWFAGSGAANSKRKPFDGQIICWNENINY